MNLLLSILSASLIALYLFLRFISGSEEQTALLPLMAVLLLGGPPLLFQQLRRLLRRDFGADLLAALSIVTSVLLREYLAGAIIVLMLSGGKALEDYAIGSASSALKALAKRMPSVAHRRRGSELTEVDVSAVTVGDVLVVFPHEICPVDGTVLEGHGTMDEAYLTGEPFQIDKAPGSQVISGAVNGDAALTIEASKLAVDSRYSKIMEVMRVSEANKPQLRRLGDQLGAIYTPAALTVALLAWVISGSPTRFLAVLVIATPCPLLIGIPVAILGSISLAARRGIVIKNPAVLERIEKCKTAIFDKTGTLTYGKPQLSETLCATGYAPKEILSLAASLERYSKHPLGFAVSEAALKEGIAFHEASEIREIPGEGLRGVVLGRKVHIVGRKAAPSMIFSGPEEALPPSTAGLECVVILDGKYAAMLRFRDTPRREGLSFIQHLSPKHKFDRTIIVSGDRDSEVRYLAEKLGISDIYAEKSPEEKVDIVRAETKKARTLFVGDGINDAPALLTATVGIAIGQNSDITSQAAGAVIMDSSLTKVDELMHIGARMRRIALQSAVGGMVLSLLGMGLACAGYLTPVQGAIFQEVIDVLAVLNAVRASWPPKDLTDF